MADDQQFAHDPAASAAEDAAARDQRLLEERERVLEWAKSRFEDGPTCSLCGHSDWTTTEIIDLNPHIDGGRTGRTFPVFTLICLSCGQTLFFNALVAGVALQDPSAPPLDPAASSW